jgi:CRP-like cAMP-binding protein
LTTSVNHLLEMLSGAARRRLLSVGELVPLVMGESMGEPGAATRFVHFPIDGFISLITPIDGKPSLEVGMVGREGMLGAQVALGIFTTPLHAVVQGPGTAWRIRARAFGAELNQNPRLQRLMKLYIHVLMHQFSMAAACLRFHQIEQRLARWLLMSHDRANADQFHVTHEFLAYMLGVRRVGITNAAGVLQRGGLIAYHHGELRVLDRPGLENAACACYATERQTYSDNFQTGNK